MKSVIAITDGPIDFERFASLCRERGPAGLQVSLPDEVCGLRGHLGDAWFGIEPSDDMQNEFEHAELAEIAKAIADPCFAEVLYSDLATLNVAMNGFPDAVATLIDNDNGLILPLGEVKARGLRGEAWDFHTV